MQTRHNPIARARWTSSLACGALALFLAALPVPRAHAASAHRALDAALLPNWCATRGARGFARVGNAQLATTRGMGTRTVLDAAPSAPGVILWDEPGRGGGSPAPNQESFVQGSGNSVLNTTSVSYR